MEITDVRYQELLSAELIAKQLQAKVDKMTETADNTAVALKTWREEKTSLTQQIEELKKSLSEKQNFIDKEISVLTEKSQNWDKYVVEKETNMNKTIEDLKTNLSDKLNDSQKKFMEWLSWEKVLEYLQFMADTKANEVKISAPPSWAWFDNTTNFDKALSSWDIAWALASIKI